MINRSQVARLSLALLMGPALLIVLGCSGDDGLGKRYPVSGTVKYKGEPVAKARISFTPTKSDGHGAHGDVENGAFKLSTMGTDDGALPGEYKVTVDDREVDAAKLKADAKEAATKKGMDGFSGGAMIPQDLQAKALKASKSRLPGKYQIAETSDKKVTVEAKSNTFEIELTD